jgi:molybdopterin converting factor small subunit
MIRIKLFGGARKALGSSSMDLDKTDASIKEVLAFLRENAIHEKILDPDNIIIAINDVECSVFNGHETVVKGGDTIKIVTVVHGGVY